MASEQMGDKYDDMAEEILRVKSYAGIDEAVRELAEAIRQAATEGYAVASEILKAEYARHETIERGPFSYNKMQRDHAAQHKRAIAQAMSALADREALALARPSLAHPHKEG